MKLTIQGIEIETEGAIAVEVSEDGKRVKVTAAGTQVQHHHYHSSGSLGGGYTLYGYQGNPLGSNQYVCGGAQGVQGVPLNG